MREKNIRIGNRYFSPYTMTWGRVLSIDHVDKDTGAWFVFERDDGRLYILNAELLETSDKGWR
jgi:hypothetical protein